MPDLAPRQDSSIERLPNFLQISDDIATSGQPSVAQFAAIRAAGYRLVINLALPTSAHALTNEDRIVAAQGMRYVHIPVVWDHPTQENLARFFEVMDQRQERAFVHCSMNLRVSSFMFLYRVIRQGVPVDVARESLLKIWKPEGHWQTFIDESLARYGPAAGPAQPSAGLSPAADTP